MPDTLDLAGRAGLAINGLGGTLDPDLECPPYGQVHFDVETPVIQHWASADPGCRAKVDGSFPLMRLMSGSRQHLDREDGLHENLMARLRDGLFWDFVDPRRPWRNVYGDSDRRYGPGRGEDDAGGHGPLAGDRGRALLPGGRRPIPCTGATTSAVNVHR